MENKYKDLLTKIIQECGEITKYCSKAISYGLFSYNPNKPGCRTNGDKILIKYYRLQAYIEILQNNGVLPHYSRAYTEHIKRDVYTKFKSINKNNKR